MITLEDIKKVNITEEELYTIELYSQLYFSKDKMKGYDSQFHYRGEARNPNCTGIIGEWAFWKNYSNISLPEFLKDRITYGSDNGDGRIGKDIFDLKTMVWKSEPKFMLDKQSYCGNVEYKHMDKKFINFFIFATIFDDPSGLVVNLMGWVSKNKLTEWGTLHKKNDKKENGFIFPCDAYDIEYKRLNPMSYLNPSDLYFIKK